MSNWHPVALGCGHLLQGPAMYEMPAQGSGDPERVECPEGCGMVEFVLPLYINVEDRGKNTVEISLGWLEAGDGVEVDGEV